MLFQNFFFNCSSLKTPLNNPLKLLKNRKKEKVEILASHMRYLFYSCTRDNAKYE